MNKIEIKDNSLNIIKKDNLVDIKISNRFEMFNVQKISINIVGSTDLEIVYDEPEAKLDIEYNVKENAVVKVLELNQNSKGKIQYKYNLEANSFLSITKFYDIVDIKELDVINLNGENAEIQYDFKTIAKGSQKYDLFIYHNYPKTISDVVNSSVNINEGTTNFNVTSVVYNGIKGCTLNQNNRIINLNDKKCNIKPILLIEENDVDASHSAFVGKFNQEEIFYLMSRGITYNDSLNLLVKGFLNVDNKKIAKIINEYWG